MKSRNTNQTSFPAMIAVAGAFLGVTPLQAADLGGNCCADLEERVAELEATTARKGNRKVSLQVFGQVSESIIWWNDGAESNVYIQETANIRNKLGFTGSAKINSDWSAGFTLELQIRAYRSSAANQLALGATNNVSIPVYNTQSVSLRQAHWYLRSERYGRISVGRDFDAAVGSSTVTLVNPDGFSVAPGYLNGGYFLRRSGTTGNGGLSALTWGTLGFVRNGDGPQSFDYSHTAGLVKYTSPFLFGQSKSTGFQVQASWGMDDAWAIGLRYAENFGNFRIAAAGAYSDWRGIDRGQCSTGGSSTLNGSGLAIPGTPGPTGTAIGSTVDCNAWGGSASIKHVPTGLYLSGGGAQIEDNNRSIAAALASTNPIGGPRRGIDKNDGMWWIQAGWEAKLTPLGSTIFWGQYQAFNNGLGVNGSVVQTVAGNDVLNSLGTTALIGGSKTEIWGGGISQNIDAASMILYAGFYNFSVESTLLAQSASATVQRAKSNSVDDMQMFYTGATIKF